MKRHRVGETDETGKNGAEIGSGTRANRGQEGDNIDSSSYGITYSFSQPQSTFPGPSGLLQL